MLQRHGFIGLFFVLLFSVEISTALAADPIVYSRCERTTATYEASGIITVNGDTQLRSRTMTGLDVYDVLPDVENFFGGFATPCDLVIRDAVGAETVIHDCSTTSTDLASCAALDAAVSFDGNIIAYSVFKGPILYHRETIDSRIIHNDADKIDLGFHTLPNKTLDAEGAHLHFYNVTTQQTTVIPYVEGVWDSGPAFTSNTRISFTSTRDRHASTLIFGSGSVSDSTKIWAMDIDGRNLDLSSHHSLSQEQHPYPLKNGRMAYSSWQIFGGLPFRHTNGAIGGHTTPRNLFHIFSQFADGAHNFAIHGQHSGAHSTGYWGEDNVASHFLTQTTDGRIWIANYYRGNNKGLGVLIGVIQEPEGREGIGPFEATQRTDVFAARDTTNFAAWASNSDKFGGIMPSPPLTIGNYADPLPFAGKLGHPAALPSNGLMMSWGIGGCSTVAKSAEVYASLSLPVPNASSGSSGGVAMNSITSMNIDTPGCDVGIYKASVIPSLHPNDLTLIVDSDQWHEIMPRYLGPYVNIHGVARPTVVERADKRVTHAMLPHGTPFGLLGAASITDRETHPRGGIHFKGEHQFNEQGTDTIDYDDEDLCGVRILGVLPNKYVPGDPFNTLEPFMNYAGERVSIMGEFHVKHYNGATRILDNSGEPDTSFLVRMPANTPYLMQGIDCDGRTLNTDQSWQHLRPGEMKTCDGCHLHSKAARTTFPATYAAGGTYTIPQLGEGTVPLLTGISGNVVSTRTESAYGLHIDWTDDIFPILQARCASCHSGATPAGKLDLNTAGIDNIGETYYCLIRDKRQQCLDLADRYDTFQNDDPHIYGRPQMTRQVRAFNSLGSLLYWKAAGMRTDNRLDTDHADDIDFGAAHSHFITAEELGLLSRWIDIGAGGGSKEKLDTLKPALNLAAVVSNDTITQLNVGVVDLGSGALPSSLKVCINDNSPGCTNIAPSANPHGIVNIVLASALTDSDDTVFASISDIAGNTTQVEFTGEHLGMLEGGSPGANPIANNDTATVVNNTSVDIPVASNDTADPPKTIASWTNVTNVSNGVLTGGGTQIFNYTPSQSFTGIDSFTYTVTDSEALVSNVGTVTITVTGAVPTVTAPVVTVEQNASVIIDVAPFTQTYGSATISKVASLTGASNGTLTQVGSSFTYTPNLDYIGMDSFTFSVTDSEGGTSISTTVTITVSAAC